VCSECFRKIDDSQNKELILYKEILAKASNILRHKGFIEEAEVIDCMVEMRDKK
jgi:hypothetical protein